MCEKKVVCVEKKCVWWKKKSVCEKKSVCVWKKNVCVWKKNDVCDKRREKPKKTGAVKKKLKKKRLFNEKNDFNWTVVFSKASFFF